MAQKVSPAEFAEILKRKADMVKKGVAKSIGICCERVRTTVLTDMANTQRNRDVTYRSGKNGNIEHHPSLPGNPPAPDTGNLRASIHYTQGEENGKPIGIVGTDVEYGKHLEFGTSQMLPRPWLKPGIEKNENFIHEKLKEALDD